MGKCSRDFWVTRLSMRIISGHQPAYLPWLGYFHKLSLCDQFVYMDTVQYLEADWNNRNKIKTPQGWSWLSVPIDKKRSEGKYLNQTKIQQEGAPSAKRFWQQQHWKAIQLNYAKAPFFAEYAEPLKALYCDTVWDNLIDLCWQQFVLFRQWLGLDHIPVIRMSEHAFEGHKSDLVLDHCLQLQGDAVVVGALGQNYIDREIFKAHNIKLYFQDYQHPSYAQRFSHFEPYMCILDLVFNHGSDAINILLNDNISRNELEQKLINDS